MVELSDVNNSSPGRSCPIGIRFRLVKVTNVSLAKQLDDDDDAAASFGDTAAADFDDPVPTTISLLE